MEVRPSGGVKVKINATREAVFGEDGVEVRNVSPPNATSNSGILTGRTLVGYCEVEMPSLDGRAHWYPIEQTVGENGERIKEEELPLDVEEGEDDEE